MSRAANVSGVPPAYAFACPHSTCRVSPPEILNVVRYGPVLIHQLDVSVCLHYYYHIKRTHIYGYGPTTCMMDATNQHLTMPSPYN